MMQKEKKKPQLRTNVLLYLTERDERLRGMGMPLIDSEN
jgi:hypothetical protein